MVMSYHDSVEYYKQSLEISKKNDDFHFIAGTLEGQCACLWLKHIHND